MRIGFDIDGVLADFNTSFIQRIIDVTGRDLFPARPFDIPTWNYPEHYGYTQGEVDAVWYSIKTDPRFWQHLAAYPGTWQALRNIASLAQTGNDVYFVTSRPGVRAKQQTEKWLLESGYWKMPTVLISSAKGTIAAGLNLDAYIDDRWENALDVATTKTASTLLTRPWNTANNAEEQGIRRVATVAEFLENLTPVTV